MCAANRKDHSTEKLKLHRDGLRAQVYWDGGFREVLLKPGSSLVFGRGADCDVALDDPSVSRAHARLDVGPPLCIVDLGSANGTHVDGVLAHEGRALLLRFGALVELGDAILVVRAPPGLESGTHPLSTANRPAVDGAALLGIAKRLARSNISVSIEGEPGSGKQHFANSVHAHSARKDAPFVRVGCADWSGSTLDRELFGCVAGYARGQEAGHVGALERSNGGALYLDRVTELPFTLQDKLARALELKEFQRLGESDTLPIDCRLMAGSRIPFDAALSSGAMRPSLHHRIAGVVVQIPPLRERSAEFAGLVQVALATAASQLKRPMPNLDDGLLTLLQEYSFPDNFRELAQLLRSALLASDKMEIGIADLPAKLRGKISEKRRRHAPLKAELDEVLRARILQALEDCNGNQTRAARMLGLPRRTLVARLDALGIPRPRKGKRNP